MATRSLSSTINGPDGTGLSGYLEIEVRRRGGILVDPGVALVVGRVVHRLTLGEIPATTIYAPGVYQFTVWDNDPDANPDAKVLGGPMIGSVDDDSTDPITVQDMLDGNVPIFSAKNNWAGSAPPDADNDVTEGYSVGSLWYDNSEGTGNAVYVCRDNTDGGALWVKLGAEY